MKPSFWHQAKVEGPLFAKALAERTQPPPLPLLAAQESKQVPNTTCYYVISRHGRPFPLEMLWYDSSFPATKEAADRITSTFTGEGQPGLAIELRCYIVSPTRELWATFGWDVERGSAAA